MVCRWGETVFEERRRTAPTQRDCHLRMISERGPHGLAKSQRLQSAGEGQSVDRRDKRVIGDALRSRTDRTEATEVALAAAALNRMLGFGHPSYVRIA
jgi:hypothetical protein